MDSREQAKSKSHHKPWIDAPHHYLMDKADQASEMASIREEAITVAEDDRLWLYSLEKLFKEDV